MICFVIFGTIMCLFKDCSASPNLCVCVAILLPCIVFAIIRSLPVKSLESDKEQSDKLPTDNFMIKTGFCIAILLATCLGLCFVILGSNFSTQLIGRRIDSISVRELKQKQQKDAERLDYLNAGQEVAAGSSAAPLPLGGPPELVPADPNNSGAANAAGGGHDEDRGLLLQPI